VRLDNINRKLGYTEILQRISQTNEVFDDRGCKIRVVMSIFNPSQQPSRGAQSNISLSLESHSTYGVFFG
jgi:hypothetical protein